jgi:DNA adenine methylase
MPFYSPLRYPGGKRKLSNYMKLILAESGLLGAHYVEPYAGGAAVALALLFEGYASHIHINDLSRSVYAFWYAVLYETESLCSRIRDTAVTVDEWHRQRAVQEHALEVPLLDLGFSTFFMNRTNRSGIITGGMIGGKKQSGAYKLDARYNAEDLTDRIKRVASHQSQVSIYDQDASVFITRVLPTLPHNSLVYLDPPYYTRAKRLYENQYEYNDHKRLSHFVRSIDQRWVVTYENAPEIVRLYQGYRRIAYDLNYSAAGRYRGAELMFFCDELTIPTAANPARVSSREVLKMQTALALL